jgi:hypothetical protein
MKRSTIIYHFRGGVERGTGAPGYVWRDGYSETRGNGVLYPWMTRAECRRDVIAQGGKAKFYRDALAAV